MIKTLKKAFRKKAKPAELPARKPFRPTVERRLDKTESFFARVEKMAERRLLSHNLKRPAAEDYAAVELLQTIRDLAGANRGKVRQPTLKL